MTDLTGLENLSALEDALPQPATALAPISGTVFSDFNSNGVQEDNEVGREYITVAAYNAASTT